MILWQNHVLVFDSWTNIFVSRIKNMNCPNQFSPNNFLQISKGLIYFENLRSYYLLPFPRSGTIECGKKFYQIFFSATAFHRIKEKQEFKQEIINDFQYEFYVEILYTRL